MEHTQNAIKATRRTDLEAVDGQDQLGADVGLGNTRGLAVALEGDVDVPVGDLDAVRVDGRLVEASLDRTSRGYRNMPQILRPMIIPVLLALGDVRPAARLASAEGVLELRTRVAIAQEAAVEP